MQEKQNNLLMFSPKISDEWNYKRNDLTPDKVKPKSNKKVWWICKKGHEWETRIGDRTCKGNNCPYCSNQKIGYGNSLADNNPILIKEWHPTKNGILKPELVSPQTKKKVWWICNMGHEWEASICDRNRKTKGDGCPYCSSYPKKVCSDNCLTTKNDILAKQWHHSKNGDLTPKDVTPNSNKKVWWECFDGHEWQATINSRSQGNNCPFCQGIRLKYGVTCSSMVEAYYYIKMVESGVKFKHNKKYPQMGCCRYDFYIPMQNKYLEVTSYNKQRCKWWFTYLRKIVKKRKHVIEKLMANFQFVNFRLSRSQIRYVRENMERI